MLWQLVYAPAMARYFLHLTPTNGSPIFWRSVQNFAGVRVHYNLSLLAAALGDSPPAGASLVAPANYDTEEPGLGVVSVQPWVERRGGGLRELALGEKLKNFLDYPLGGTRKMNLSLPFYDPTLGIGVKGGGWFRQDEDESAFHCGWDVMPVSQRAADLFEVCAAADGVVEAAGSQNNTPIVLRHSAGGEDFLTIYQHLNLSGTSWRAGDKVRRGQFLARISDTTSTRHLHFMAAVRGPAMATAAGLPVRLWFPIDCFGVYDYYVNRTDLARYNYLPDGRPECFEHRIQGAVHTIQWADQPLSATIPRLQQTDYLKIRRMQFRVRDNDSRAGVPPAERNQCLVWLEGIDEFFFVPFDSPSRDHALEMKMIDFLAQCFDSGRKVKIEHYPVAGERRIAAVWANA